MDPIYSVMYILLGAVVGMIYGLRRIFILEEKINRLLNILERQESKELKLLLKKKQR